MERVQIIPFYIFKRVDSSMYFFNYYFSLRGNKTESQKKIPALSTHLSLLLSQHRNHPCHEKALHFAINSIDSYIIKGIFFQQFSLLYRNYWFFSLYWIIPIKIKSIISPSLYFYLGPIVRRPLSSSPCQSKLPQELSMLFIFLSSYSLLLIPNRLFPISFQQRCYCKIQQWHVCIGA